MTSGNLSDEPICYDDADARRPPRRRSPTPGWCTTVRSTSRATTRSSASVDGDRAADPPVAGLRTAPDPRSRSTSAPILAVGGELKNTFCLASRPPRLDEPAHRRHGQPRDARRLRALDRGSSPRCTTIDDPDLVADAHPGYHTRALGRSRAPATATGARAAPPRPRRGASWPSTASRPASAVIGFAFDGTGYGPDGAIWGGEVLRRRLRRLRTGRRTFGTCRCPAATPPSASRHRAALAHLWAAGIAWDADLAAGARRVERRSSAALRAPARAERAVRADVEHGPALRRGQLARSGSATSSRTRPRPPSSSRRPRPRRRSDRRPRRTGSTVADGRARPGPGAPGDRRRPAPRRRTSARSPPASTSRWRARSWPTAPTSCRDDTGSARSP